MNHRVSMLTMPKTGTIYNFWLQWGEPGFYFRRRKLHKFLTFPDSRHIRPHLLTWSGCPGMFWGAQTITDFSARWATLVLAVLRTVRTFSSVNRLNHCRDDITLRETENKIQLAQLNTCDWPDQLITPPLSDQLITPPLSNQLMIGLEWLGYQNNAHGFTTRSENNSLLILLFHQELGF